MIDFDHSNKLSVVDTSSDINGDASFLHSDLPPALARYVETIGDLLDRLDEDEFLKSASIEVEKLIKVTDLLSEEQMVGNPDTYTRHPLYFDPEGRFSVLALVWMPGQFTCVHGHSAWGVVGVREGEINVVCYDLQSHQDKPAPLIQTANITAGVGDVSTVSTAPEGIHRLGNSSDKIAITLHTYGMDLSENPARINVVYAD